MKILGLIPARGGSKGVPRKNIKLLAGKPLIQYSIEAGLACQEIDELIVSTEDEEIAAISKRIGAKVPFLRPAELAADHSPTIDSIIHALAFYEAQNIFFDAVCLLQPTCPFRTATDILHSINIFKKDLPDSLISVQEVPAKFNPHWTFEAVPNTNFLKIATGEQQIIPRRQELPKAYYRDGAIYITSRDILMKQRSLYGERIAYFSLKNDQHVNIDTLADWEEAEQLMKAK